MSAKTGIQWTDATWNPITGCSKVSAGCAHCYAERDFHRPYPGRAFTDVRTHPERLDQPLRWGKARKIFVNSLSDLFHDAVSDEFIDLVFAAMALSERHTFQLLTKRPEKMRAYVQGLTVARLLKAAPVVMGYASSARNDGRHVRLREPLPNLWPGVSVENQETADERIPILMQTPAAVRSISAEPLLAPIDLTPWLRKSESSIDHAQRVGHHRLGEKDRLDWVIVGGESGPDARPCNLDWIRDIVRQCKSAGVPVFVKQLGSHVHQAEQCGRLSCSPLEPWDGVLRLHDRHGGDPAEWPEDLRVREFPLSPSSVAPASAPVISGKGTGRDAGATQSRKTN